MVNSRARYHLAQDEHRERELLQRFGSRAQRNQELHQANHAKQQAHHVSQHRELQCHDGKLNEMNAV